jgi:hypothetical protein
MISNKKALSSMVRIPIFHQGKLERFRPEARREYAKESGL